MAPLALLSTSNKAGIVDLAHNLIAELGFEILSSGGTAAAIAAAGLPVTKVSDYTGSPEILGGRVKTLHPRIHGGILARKTLEADQQDLAANDIRAIDLVVVNLYPFTEAIANPDTPLAEAIENIDIGGPTLLRAAAKNYAHTTVLSDPLDYLAYLIECRRHQGTPSLAFRKQQAIKAFNHTADYDRAITEYLIGAEGLTDQALPSAFSLSGKRRQKLRYGENPHQQAAWYETGNGKTGWCGAVELQGRELSYNNLVDLEAARQIIAELTEKPAVAILKHTNPCGVAVAETLLEAYQKALAADPTSAFGGIVALNRPIDCPTAEQLTSTFLECVVAPGCDPEAEKILHKKAKVRVLVLPDWCQGPEVIVKCIAGGFLLQESDRTLTSPEDWQVVTEKPPTPAQLTELLFAWKVVKHVKSNAIVITKDQTTCGIGAGQMNRVGSVKIAVEQAREKARGAVLASDAFFPFDDSVRVAAAAGIEAIVQPGGSLRDQEAIAAANELGLVMVFTGTRHFLH